MEQKTGRKEPKCRGFLLYYGDMEILRELLNAAQFRNVLFAVMDYMKTGEEPAFSGKERSAFKVLKEKADWQMEAYTKTCDRNRKIAQNRKKQTAQEQEASGKNEEETICNDSLPLVTTGDDSLPLVTTGNQIKENKIRENKIKQNQTEEDNAVQVTPTEAQEKLFSAFRAEYPKKQGIYRALPAFIKAVDTAGFDTVMAGLKRQKRVSDWKKAEGRFVPNADKWLTERRWEDFPETSGADKYALPSMY